MPTCSQPLQEVVGHGHNAKHVKDCTELFLGGKGIEQLAGFERLVNLEVLWLTDNKLSALNHLDSNIRIKQLYAHNNAICTLKGSLLNLKFLSQLDLSNNQLRDLQKLLKTLQKLHVLKELNLQGNPCCEEPDYRLHIVHAIPSLEVLDHHQVTTAERAKAAAVVGGYICSLTVAFGTRLPQSAMQFKTAAAAPVGEHRSVLEQELAQRATAIKEKQHKAAVGAEQAWYAANPDAAYLKPCNALPPPPGVLRAQQAWTRGSSGSLTLTESCKATGTSGSLGSGTLVNSLNLLDQMNYNALQSTIASGSVNLLEQSNSSAKGLIGGSATAGNAYVAKDILYLQHCNKRKRPKNISPAEPSYLQGTFKHHLTAQQWEATDVKLRL